MSPIFAGITVVLALLVLVTAVNMLWGPFLAKRRPGASPQPSLSICIPARNEEASIGQLLSSLQPFVRPDMEILVLDDHSTDGTAQVLRGHEPLLPTLRLLQGASLPTGWTGKNWACHQLAQQARGEVLLFVDADVWLESDALGATLDALRNYRADALSAFPRQQLDGVVSKAVVPIMDLLLYAFLPLQLVHRTRARSLAAANGQWIAFRRSCYEAIGGHAGLRSEVVEDIALARAVKQHGFRMLLTSGVGMLRCRMYRSPGEVLRGFSKTFFAAFDFRAMAFVPMLLFMLLVFVLPFIWLAIDARVLILTAIGLNVLLRTFMSIRLRHGWLSVILHPFGILGAVGIGMHAIWQRYRRGSVIWKDRAIPVGDRTR
ncbi:MAG TPA: glycosyltransferase family 2 protein [Bacteroidota bacterium]|nr:glycosyltransferase family 2 protein [Bacteroidota bacterium]